MVPQDYAYLYTVKTEFLASNRPELKFSDPLFCNNGTFWHTLIYWESIKIDCMVSQSIETQKSIEKQLRAMAQLNNKSHLLRKAMPLRCREVAVYRNKQRGEENEKTKECILNKMKQRQVIHSIKVQNNYHKDAL